MSKENKNTQKAYPFRENEIKQISGYCEDLFDAKTIKIRNGSIELDKMLKVIGFTKKINKIRVA